MDRDGRRDLSRAPLLRSPSGANANLATRCSPMRSPILPWQFLLGLPAIGDTGELAMASAPSSTDTFFDLLKFAAPWFGVAAFLIFGIWETLRPRFALRLKTA